MESSRRLWPLGTVILANVALAAMAVVREVVLASSWGTAPLADAYLLSMYLPDFLGNFLAASALNSAAVPFLARAARRSGGDLDRACRLLLAQVLPPMAAVTVVVGWAAPALMRLLGPGLAPVMQERATWFLRAMLPGMLVYPVFGLAGARHLISGCFWRPAFGPVLLNACAALGLGLASASGRVEYMAYGYTAGVAAMCALQLGPWLWRPRPGSAPDARPVYTAFVPLGAAVVVTHLAAGVERAVASSLGTGCVAALNYVTKLVNFPLWIFVTAVSTVTFAELSHDAARGDAPAARDRTRAALKLVMLVCTPLAAVIFTLRRQLLALLFGYGAFDLAAVELSGKILTGYTFFIPAAAMVYVLSRAAHARSDFGRPLRAAAAAALVMVVLRVAGARLGPGMLGWATAAGAWVGAGVLGLGQLGGLGVHPGRLAASGARLVLVTLPVAVAGWTAAGIVSDSWLGAELGRRLGGMTVVGLVVLAAFAGGCALAGLIWPGALLALPQPLRPPQAPPEPSP